MRAIDAKHFLLSARLHDVPDDAKDAYPFGLAAVRALDPLTFHPNVTFLVGENGSGKSTIIEALAIALGMNAEGGSQNFAFSTRASHSNLADHLRMARSVRQPRSRFFLRAESYFNLGTEIERLDQGGGGPPIIDAYGGQSLHEQSHGESFFALFEERLVGGGLYLFDEPEAALSPTRQLQFLRLLDAHVEAGSQFVIATHSPIIMAYPRATIYELSAHGLQPVPYQATEHFAVTRRFLANPDAALDELLGT